MAGWSAILIKSILSDLKRLLPLCYLYLLRIKRNLKARKGSYKKVIISKNPVFIGFYAYFSGFEVAPLAGLEPATHGLEIRIRGLFYWYF